jgi:pimeloyl-ACP methyl ester carboxylesterase
MREADTARRSLQPTRIQVPQARLDDLRSRLERTHWAQEIDGAGWEYGVPLARLRPLVDAWRTRWDWRAWETRLNAYPQFTTVIDGQTIHFLHVRSARDDALPLILTHGWPGSVFEFLDLIDRLVDPDAHGAPGQLAFHVVVPSMPGFGFSGPTTERGWDTRRIARAWIELMRRLRYDRYGSAGNDWGSYVAPDMGRLAPKQIVGVHVTQVFDAPGRDDVIDPTSPEEVSASAGLEWFDANMSAYDIVQTQQPQTIAHALADSPVGLLAWHLNIYRDGLDPDYILANVSTHWLTDTVASAMRLYHEDRRLPRRAEPMTLPFGLAQFRNDTQAIRRFAAVLYPNIAAWNSYDMSGHFAAHEVPDVLAADLRAFFSSVRI